ncbi:DUF4321 domain-containing protein [Brevibacillus laterosporus]|nr:DUF4321 domain-containing protein [Brevibacillus laterosporus]
MTGKEFVILLIVLLSGLLFGSLLGQILGPWIPFLRESKMLTWSPAADLDILKYNLHFEVKLNLASIGGLVFAFWIYKKFDRGRYNESRTANRISFFFPTTSRIASLLGFAFSHSGEQCR